MFGIDIPVPASDGRFISEKHARIAELIHDYDHNLELAWIPPDRRSDPRDKPFAVIETTREGRRDVVCYADECDERLLARVYSMDSKHNTNIGLSLEAHNRAVLALEKKKRSEEMQEQHEIAAAILRSPKDTYRVGKKVFKS